MKERATINGNARRMRNRIIGTEVYGKITFKSIMPVLCGCSIEHVASTSLSSLLLVERREDHKRDSNDKSIASDLPQCSATIT